MLSKFGVPRQIFVKFCNIGIHENPSIWSRTDAFGRTDGQTDKHDAADRRF